MMRFAVGSGARNPRVRQEETTVDDFVDWLKSYPPRHGELLLKDYLEDKRSKGARSRADKDGLYFIPARFRVPHRNNDNVEELYAFVGDLDTGGFTAQDIEARLKPYRFLAYTSYSHVPDDPKWRFIVFYSRPVRPDEHARLYQHFQRLFDGKLDDAPKDPSRLWYLPGCPRDAVQYREVIEGKGALFDPDTVPRTNGGNGSSHPGDSQQRAGLLEIGEVIQALTRIQIPQADGSGRYRLWTRIGMAVHAATGGSEEGLAAWRAWSEEHGYRVQECVKKWPTYKPGKGIGAGTLIAHARESGGIADAAPDAGSADGAVPAEIAQLNRDYFVAKLKGEPMIWARHELEGQDTWAPISRASFMLGLENRHYTYATHDKTVKVPLAKHWLAHSSRRQYEGVSFDPRGETPGTFNRWNGYARRPRAGQWSKFNEHLLNVVCSENVQHHAYLLDWMAYALQHPDQPAGTAIVMRGAPGAGKGIVARMFGEIFKPHFRHTSNPKHLTGNFNAHLEDCLFLFVDEGYWAGDRSAAGVMKQLITEPLITIERKGFDAYTAKNYLHIMIASNSDWVVPADAGDRRFFVLDVDSARARDKAYFDPIYTEMEQGGIEAMMHELLTRPLEQWNKWRVPTTRGHVDQKLRSLHGFDAWWFDCLRTGEVMEPNVGRVFRIGEESIPCRVVSEAYARSARDHYERSRSIETVVGTGLKKLIPAVRIVRRADTSRTREYYLPDLTLCRRAFELATGMVDEIAWEEVGGWTGRKEKYRKIKASSNRTTGQPT